MDGAEEALIGLVRDLAEEIAAGYALELAAATAPPAQAPAPADIPEPKKGAAAVHPQLDGKLVTLPGDTISGHAHAHVPQPLELPAPDARDNAIAELHQTLAVHRQADLERIAAEQAAAEAQRTGIPAPGTYRPLDDDQYAAHVARAGRLVTESLDAGHATDRAETLDGHGQAWAPERAAQHNEIVKVITGKAAGVPSEGQAVLAGGPDRAARAAVLKQAAARHAVVSPDAIKAELGRRGMVPEAEGLSPAERSALVHAEAGHVANLAVSRLAAARKNLALDLPMADADAARGHLGRLRQHGYVVHGAFAHTPADVASRRLSDAHRKGLESYRQGTGDGGRLRVVTPETPGGTPNKDAFDALRGEFDSWELHDASKGRPVLAEQSPQPPRDHGIAGVEDLMRQAK
jgi:hypothetical protein